MFLMSSESKVVRAQAFEVIRSQVLGRSLKLQKRNVERLHASVEHGLRLSCLALQSKDMVIEKTCAGMFSLIVRAVFEHFDRLVKAITGSRYSSALGALLEWC